MYHGTLIIFAWIFNIYTIQMYMYMYTQKGSYLLHTVYWNCIRLPEYIGDLHSRYVVYYQVQIQRRINLSRPHCPTALTQKSSGARHLCNNTKLALPLEKYINVLLNISYEYYLFYRYHIKRNWKSCSLIIHQIQKKLFWGIFKSINLHTCIINIKLMEVMIKHFGNLMVFEMLIYNEYCWSFWRKEGGGCCWFSSWKFG